jgi:pepsin A
VDKIDLKIETTNDLIYSSYIYVGNPPQKMRALFDTGSSNLWIAGHMINKTGIKREHNYYDPKKSTTAQKVMPAKNGGTKYGSGFLEGSYYNDDIWIGLNGTDTNGTDKMIHLKNL